MFEVLLNLVSNTFNVLNIGWITKLSLNVEYATFKYYGHFYMLHN